MAITFVQSANGGSSVAFSSNTTFKNFLIILMYANSTAYTSPVFTCNDSNGNLYIPLSINVNTLGTAIGKIFYVVNNASGANTVVGTLFDGIDRTSELGIAVHEFTELNNLDVTASANGVGLVQNSGNVTTNISSELIFGYEVAPTSGGQASVTKGASYTLGESLAAGGAITQYKIVSSVGSYSSDTTSTVVKSGTCNWVETIATFYFLVPTFSSIVDF